MDIPLTRAQVLPVDEASVFTVSLDLCEPRLIRVTAYGPLAGSNPPTRSLSRRGSTRMNITGAEKGGGFLWKCRAWSSRY